MAPVATREAALVEEADERLFEPHSGATLEDLVLAAWGELVSEGRTECPVCGGQMAPARGCADCGSELT